jgi:hypothetical protein
VYVTLLHSLESPLPNADLIRLPRSAYIADTGIATQRDAIKEKEETQTLKQKSRERVQPKMGKIDIDYQKLHDAFFRFQTKPKLTSFGEVCVRPRFFLHWKGLVLAERTS